MFLTKSVNLLNFILKLRSNNLQTSSKLCSFFFGTHMRSLKFTAKALKKTLCFSLHSETIFKLFIQNAYSFLKEEMMLCII